MKKYELIKTYPGSPKLGTIVESVYGSESYTYNEYHLLSKGCIEDYPKYWKEIINITFNVNDCNQSST
jgi:hypothetical protein